MNTITTKLDTCDFKIYEDYLNFKIDDCFLNDMLQVYYPGPEFKGLVPTLLPWLAIVEEQAVVWQRILPEVNTTQRCPILMCPDDCDFSCSLIIAEITHLPEKVIWKRLGYSSDAVLDPEKVGERVDWLDRVPILEFEVEQYKQALSVFKKALTAATI